MDMSRVLQAITLSLVLPLMMVVAGCQSGPTLREVLPGSKPFKIDRWEIAILATRPAGTTDRVQLDVAVQEVDGLGMPDGHGIESGRETVTVGRPMVWDRVAATDERSLQIVVPVCRRSGDEIVVELKVVASEQGKVVSTRPLEFKIR